MMQRSIFRTLLLAMLSCWVCPAVFADGDVDTGPPAMFREEGLVIVLASDGSALTAERAWELMRSKAGYQLTRSIDETSGTNRMVIYRDASELEGYLPAPAVAAMVRRAKGQSGGADPALGKAYPPDTYGLLEGGEIAMESLRGKVVVLNYWFVACAPCIIELPALNRLVKRFEGREVEFVAVTFDDAETVRGLLEKREFDYRLALTSQDDLRELGISTYPTHLVLDREGVVRHVQRGLGGVDHLEEELGKAIEVALE